MPTQKRTWVLKLGIQSTTVVLGVGNIQYYEGFNLSGGSTLDWVKELRTCYTVMSPGNDVGSHLLLDKTEFFAGRCY